MCSFFVCSNTKISELASGSKLCGWITLFIRTFHWVRYGRLIFLSPERDGSGQLQLPTSTSEPRLVSARFAYSWVLNREWRCWVTNMSFGGTQISFQEFKLMLELLFKINDLLFVLAQKSHGRYTNMFVLTWWSWLRRYSGYLWLVGRSQTSVVSVSRLVVLL